MTEEELKGIEERNHQRRVSHVMTRWENGCRRELYRSQSEAEIEDVDALLAEVKRLHTALEFYAYSDNWMAEITDRFENGQRVTLEAPVNSDEGKKAREALGMIP